MNVVNVRHLSVVFGGVILLLTAPVAAQEFKERIVKTGVHEGHLFLSGEDISIRAEVNGDIVAMGDDVEVDSQVAGDLIVMGGDLDIDSDITGEVLALAGSAEIGGRIRKGANILGGSLRVDGDIDGPSFVAGGKIEASGNLIGNAKLMGAKIVHSANVDGDLMAVAAKVELEEDSSVSGKAWVTGASVEVDGTIGGELRVAARSAEIGGRIEGNVHIDAVEIEILPSAVISGNLYYESGQEANIHPDATIVGDVDFERSDRPRRTVGMAHAGMAMGLLATIGGLILLGAVQILVCPNFSVKAARAIGGSPWKSLGLGFALLVAGPVLIVILVGLVIGIPLGMALTALYALMILAGLLVASTAVGMKTLRLFGRQIGERFWQRFGVLTLGVLILAIVALIPVLGAIVFCVAVMLGVGALTIKAHDAHQAG